MQGILIAFMAVVMCITLLALVMMVYDMVSDRRDRAAKRDTAEAARQVASAPAPVVPSDPVAAPAPIAPIEPEPPVAEPEPEPVKEPVQVSVRTDSEAEPEVMEIDPEVAATLSGDNAVVFASAKHETLDDKYAALSPEFKRYYDELVVYAASVEKSKRFKNARYEEYKVGSGRLVRLTIKRGVIVCEYLITNPLFRTYAKDNKVSVKQSPTVLKITDAASFQAAKDSIDLAARGIEEDRQLKKEMQKAKRRERKDSDEQ